MNYLLISDGKQGAFKFEFDTLQEAIDQGKKMLQKENSATIYTKHSDLRLDEVTVIKSDLQLQTDQAIIEANAIKVGQMESVKP